MTLTRRKAIAHIGGAALAAGPAAALAAPSMAAVTIAARVPWMVNQVAVTSDNRMFLGLPRYPDHEQTPCVVRREADGTLKPFPGQGWNDWKPGDDGLNAFVYVNSVHIFADDTVWCVDQGTLRLDAGIQANPPPAPGAQKIVQLDPVSGKVLRVIRFAPEILPPGAQINDLRIFGRHVYVTDSGLGALIVHDLQTGHTLRRLSGAPEVLAVVPPPVPGAPPMRHRIPKSDMIELSLDGEWLYWSAPTGPFRRIRTAILRDPQVPDSALHDHVEHVADIGMIGGSAIDDRGNLYLSELKTRRITVLAPDGRTAVLAASDDFMGPDNSFIGFDRTLYVPVSQAGRTRLFGNATDMTQVPFLVYAIALPKVLDGIELGGSINARMRRA
jgi:sugar lactone lactonase YvrE